jgi:hypothetical protein
LPASAAESAAGGWVGTRLPDPARMLTLQRLALSGDSAEAVQLNELQEHRPCLSPERAILFRTLLVLLRVDNHARSSVPSAADLCQWNDHDWPLGVVGQSGRHRP